MQLVPDCVPESPPCPEEPEEPEEPDEPPELDAPDPEDVLEAEEPLPPELAPEPLDAPPSGDSCVPPSLFVPLLLPHATMIPMAATPTLATLRMAQGYDDEAASHRLAEV